MADYKKMYLKLFVAVSETMELLKKASLEAEELYVFSEEMECRLVDFKQEDCREETKRT